MRMSASILGRGPITPALGEVALILPLWWGPTFLRPEDGPGEAYHSYSRQVPSQPFTSPSSQQATWAPNQLLRAWEATQGRWLGAGPGSQAKGRSDLEV